MKIVAVVGPTASGKTDLGVQLAKALDGEVVNADSMQLYRGLDIGSAKASLEERQGVPHHLLDVWDVTEPASVAEYQRLARAAIAQVHARGRTAVLVGGSGLYVRAVLDEMAFPGTDEAVRARLEQELAEVGALALHARLAELDPAAAAAIEPRNGRRVVRALEVGEITGRGFVAELPEPTYAAPAVQVGLRVPRPELDERIARRVDVMWERGLVEETRELAGRGLREGPTASRALGYAQVLRVLDGEADEGWAREETVRATRRFARRQESWFRRDVRVHWLDAGAGDAAGLVDRALRSVAGHE
ncbi:tRNA (adenosine(37)-N6)-dimethylallyltransferase MiaA [Motilibacter deserti]|uniref:tRNA dimethylallyltransferase n=1 Tax=Motilibacter deserti TaxID=2714956 RepID=A0ABX0GVA9_9ACTN|nr:tRNA (adenosine(37)-N6)-dimethylallyltransferase MiaA [Motilibacter deserti]NHC13636.1 tRNA (adenosine(37)-N6)-dimethylallyltransferase MiaA [Motilibacter deserti]